MSNTKNELDLSVIIVSWNVKELLLQTLNSIYSAENQINFEVIVVDNASSDNSVQAVSENFSQVKIIANNINLGFATACHQGADIARGEIFLFLNDDVIVHNKAFDEIKKAIYSQKNIGVVGGLILNPDKTIQPSVRDLPTFRIFLILLLKLHRFFPGLFSNYLKKDFSYNKKQKVKQVMGAFFATPRSIWQMLKGFDKNFFIWFEEVDYCQRSIDAGLDVVFWPAAKITHYGGASFNQLRALKEQKLFNDSLLYYAKKHFSGWQVIFLYILIPINIFLATLVQISELIYKKK